MAAKKEKATAVWIGLETNNSECCSKQHPHIHIGSYLKTEWAAVENNILYFALGHNSCSLVNT
jgi:hypothetical protein